MRDALLTLTEACSQVRLSPWTLRRAIQRGELYAFKPAGRLRIPQTALDEWLRSTVPEPEIEITASPPPSLPSLPATTPQASDSFRARLRKKAS